MPRREPLTRHRIEKRRELGFGPREVPKRNDPPASKSNQPSCRCNFDDALEILGRKVKRTIELGRQHGFAKNAPKRAMRRSLISPRKASELKFSRACRCGGH